jgi:hypothetical protein
VHRSQNAFIEGRFIQDGFKLVQAAAKGVARGVEGFSPSKGRYSVGL